jgi:hypothetical protein
MVCVKWKFPWDRFISISPQNFCSLLLKSSDLRKNKHQFMNLGDMKIHIFIHHFTHEKSHRNENYYNMRYHERQLPHLQIA